MTRLWAAAAVALPLVLAVACSSSTSVTSTGASSSGGAESSDSGVASAKTLIDLARKGLIYGPTSGDVNASSLHAATASDIQAFQYKPVTGTKKVALLVASPTSSGLVHLGKIMAGALAKLNIRTQTFFGDFTPPGAQAAMNSALAINPAALVLIDLVPASITPQIETAKTQNIPVIDVTGSEQIEGGGLAAYSSESFNLVQILQAAYIVANGGPKAKSVWFTLPTFPTVETKAGINYLRSICSGCKITQTPMTVAQYSSPVLFGQVMTATLRSNPNARFVNTPAACGPLSAGEGAIKQAASRAAFGSGGCPSAALAAMNAGYVKYVAASSEAWNALTGVDQLLRVLSGQKPLASVGPGAFFIDKQNTPTSSMTPTDGEIDRWLVKNFDFVAPYSKAWGVDLSSLIANEK